MLLNRRILKMNYEVIEHHGVLGQKWGIRRYQNADGSLTRAGRKHLQQVEKKDIKWANKNYDKITSKAYKQSQKELSQYDRMLQANIIRGKSYINAHNQKMAELMNTKVSDLSAPSGRAVKFVAKRGEMGVHMALADQNYDMSKLKNGVWNDGRVAYKKNSVNVSSDISHHGVKGMHWGIRKDALGSPYFRTGSMEPEEYARACDLWRKTQEFPGLSGREKEHVYEELDNNLSDDERTYAIVSRRIDNYLYTAIQKGHNEYKIIDKERKEPPTTWEEQLDDILTEVIGKDWRRYDD